MALRLKRGNTTQRLATTPVDGELVFDTTENKLYVGKNNTAGGVPVVSGVIGGLVGSNIDLNGRDITGTGNINITGTITASGTITGNGDLVLGNAATDNVQFGADINSNIVPNTTSLTLGATDKVWNTVYIQNIANTNASTAINVNSTLVLNQNTTVAANVIPNANGQRNLGSSNLAWSGVYSDQFKSSGLMISGNNVSATESNADITLTPSGTGSVATARINATSHVNIGGVNPVHIEDVGGTAQSIHYFYDNGAGLGQITERAEQRNYTQLVNNAAEAISFAPIDGTVINAAKITASILTNAGSQIIEFLYLYSSGTGQVTTLSNTWVGTKPINTVGLQGGSQSIIQFVTNTTATAGIVYKIKLKQTLFRSN
jgi:hypothetical protein